MRIQMSTIYPDNSGNTKYVAKTTSEVYKDGQLVQRTVTESKTIEIMKDIERLQRPPRKLCLEQERHYNENGKKCPNGDACPFIHQNTTADGRPRIRNRAEKAGWVVQPQPLSFSVNPPRKNAETPNWRDRPNEQISVSLKISSSPEQTPGIKISKSPEQLAFELFRIAYRGPLTFEQFQKLPVVKK